MNDSNYLKKRTTKVLLSLEICFVPEGNCYILEKVLSWVNFVTMVVSEQVQLALIEHNHCLVISLPSHLNVDHRILKHLKKTLWHSVLYANIYTDVVDQASSYDY